MGESLQLGFHPGFAAGALTKHEVCALLCKEGLVRGYWSIPEYDLKDEKPWQAVDVVWAKRTQPLAMSVWAPSAAFEVEGHDTDESVDKDFRSLGRLQAKGCRTRAIVLFQVGPDGGPWHCRRDDAGRVEAVQSVRWRLEMLAREAGVQNTIEVVMDEALPTFLSRLST